MTPLFIKRTDPGASFEARCFLFAEKKDRHLDFVSGLFAAIIAAVFVVLNIASALPAIALDESTTRYPTTEGYNDHDYQKLVAFLEQTDEEGVKNGEKLSEDYDPNDPETWGHIIRKINA